MIQVVTFNVWVGKNFDLRKGLILDKIEAESPDLIGFQECDDPMAAFLRRHLPEYLFLGNGRNADYRGENNMIAVKRDRFEVMSLDTFWLSDTPDVPGTRYSEQSNCPRLCTHVLLRPWEGGEPFHYYNTHLDHESDWARVLGAQAIRKRMLEDQQSAPFRVILTGDMNATPDSQAISVLRGTPDFPLEDLTGHIPNSWHGYGKKPDYPRIDYVFVHGFRAAKPARAWDDCPKYTLSDPQNPIFLYLSDHYPLAAYLED